MSENINEQIECCDCNEIHEDLLKIVNDTMPEETELYDLAELFKVFGDSTRIRILFVLFEAEVCVCDLAKVLNMTQSAISHQLRILKANKLVNSRREGKSVYYSSICSRPCAMIVRRDVSISRNNTGRNIRDRIRRIL